VLAKWPPQQFTKEARKTVASGSSFG